MKLTHQRIAIINTLLENKRRQWTIYALHKETRGLTYPAVFNFVKELEQAKYLAKTKGKYIVTNKPALIDTLAYNAPFQSKEKIAYYHAGEDKSEDARRKLVANIGKEYALTLFAASELIKPYAMVSQLHAYVYRKQLESWRKALFSNGVRPTTEAEGNLFLLPISDKDQTIRQAKEIKGYKVAPIGTLLADLKTYGALGAEQAVEMLKQ